MMIAATPTKRMLSGWVYVLATLVCGTTGGAELVPFESQWSYLNPGSLDEDPSVEAGFDQNWFEPSFDISNWSSPAPAPFAWPHPEDGVNINAFTPDAGQFVREANTFLDRPEEGERFSTYYRHSFTTTQPHNNLALELLADDGAAIYLNGQQVAMFNCCELVEAGDNPTFTDLATQTGNENTYSYVELPGVGTLAPGEHTLAVQVVSSAVTSSDMGFSARLLDGFARQPLIETDQEWKYFEGFAEPSDGDLTWTEAGFDDTAWPAGVEGFGYESSGEGGVLTDELVKTELPDMEFDYTSLYLRKEFNVANPAQVSVATLGIDYDDSFIAYVNGTLVATSLDDIDPEVGVPFDVIGNDIGADHESSNGDGAGETFLIDFADHPGLLQAGANVLAIHGINRNPSSDFVLAQMELISLTGGGGSGVPGDFDGDGELTEADIDQLHAAIRDGSDSPIFDLSGDGIVNEDDPQVWVNELKRTYFGDANLDGQFNSNDFVTVFVAGEFEDGPRFNSTWAEGDWNGDGDFTSSDFVIAFVSGGFENGPRVAAAVPEPGSLVLCLFGLAVISLGGRRLK